MRNIHQGLVATCGVVALLASGCAWDGKDLPAHAVEVPAPATIQAKDDGMQFSHVVEIVKREGVVADLPAQF